MATLETVEQEKQVKEWLKENGGAIVLGLALAFGGLFGFKQWQAWEQSKWERASAEYLVMVDLLAEENLDAAVANYETLKADYSESAYAAMAALRMARARIQADQTDLAVAPLEFAISHGQPAALQTIARGRLARVQIDLGEPESAMATLDGASSEVGFEALFAEIRGDAYLALGDHENAQAQYDLALESLESGTGNRTYLEIKKQAVARNGVAPSEATTDEAPAEAPVVEEGES